MAIFKASFFKHRENRESVFSFVFTNVNVLCVTPKEKDIAEIYFGSVNGPLLYRFQ